MAPRGVEPIRLESPAVITPQAPRAHPVRTVPPGAASAIRRADALQPRRHAVHPFAPTFASTENLPAPATTNASSTPR